MSGVISIVGFGEAGQAFARGWNRGSKEIRAYDVAVHDPDRRATMRAAFAERSVTGCERAEEAVHGVSTVFCLVPTDQAMVAARTFAPLLDEGTLWLDGSSSAPGTKRQAAEVVEQGRGHYVDMAIMAPVFPKLHKTPILLSGPSASAAQELMESLAMTSRVIGHKIGDASAVKMLRSVMIKGIEALTAECFLAARKAGVEGLVLESLSTSGADGNWPVRVKYNLERMSQHGTRRAAEMREVAKTIDELGLPHWMAVSSALWQDKLAGLPVACEVDALSEHLDQILLALR